MRYHEVIRNERRDGEMPWGATDLAEAEIEELGGTEHFGRGSSRVRGALIIGLLTAVVSYGLGGRYLASLDEVIGGAGDATAVPVAATPASEAPVVTIETPTLGQTVRGASVAVRAEARGVGGEVWLVGRLGRLVLGEVETTVRSGRIEAELPLVLPPDAPVTTVDLAIESRVGGLLTLATGHVLAASTSPVRLEAIGTAASDGGLELRIAGVAPAGTVVRTSISPSDAAGATTVVEVITGQAVADEAESLPFGLARWACFLPLDPGWPGLTIDIEWVSPGGEVGRILLSREAEEIELQREGS